MTDDDVTLGEVHRICQRLEKRLEDGDTRFREQGEALVRLETQVSAMQGDVKAVQCELRGQRRKALGSASTAGAFTGGVVWALAQLVAWLRGG